MKYIITHMAYNVKPFFGLSSNSHFSFILRFFYFRRAAPASLDRSKNLWHARRALF